jgi:release factor glutamine methyltransferase
MESIDPRHTDVTQRLRAAGCVFAEDEATILLVEASDDAALESLIARRVSGEPLEYIVGWAEFGGLRVRVTPGVFVPRQRTMTLVDEAAELLVGSLGPDPSGALVVDLCCGSGAIGAVLLDRLPGLELHAADLDPFAVACARVNLAPHPTASVHHGDLLDALPARLRGRIAVLVANTPYVPHDAIASMPPEAREHEAPVALDGGADGLDVQRRLATNVGDWLAPGGHVLVESSAGQADVAAAVFAPVGPVHVRSDEQQGGTVVIATKPAR